MITVSGRTLTGAVGRNAKINGNISGVNSIQGAVSDTASLTGLVGQDAKITGHISGTNSMKGAVSGASSVTGYLSIGTILEPELNTFIIVDGDGNEIPAVLVDNELVVTGTPNDVRQGITVITNDGVIVGEKIIPSYHTDEGYRAITKGSRFTIPHEHYDYEKLQVVICRFNVSPAKSVCAIKVALENSVYDVNSTTVLSTVIRDEANTRIDLGITNDTDGICVIRYFMYKEIY